MNLNSFQYLALIIVCGIILYPAKNDMLFSMTPATEISGWTPAMPLPEGLAVRTSIAKNGFLYVVGGRQQDVIPSKEVYFAALNQNGSLDQWNRTAVLPGKGLYLHSLSATDKHLYVIGGWDRFKQHNEVWRAEFQSRGGLDSWSQVSTYPIPIYGHSSMIINNRIYSIGGWDEVRSVGLQQVYYADIQLNGDLGQWSEATGLPTLLARHTSIVHSNNIYVIGGYDGGNRRNEIYRSIFTDGNLTGWQQMRNLPEPREYHQSVIHNGKLVIIGGRDASGNEISSVIAAPINADGSLGEWDTTLPSLEKTLYRFAAVSVERHDSDYIFAMGGIHGGVKQNTVYYSDVPPSPTATPTHTSTPTHTPTPTNTPTLTPTPANTPTPSVQLFNVPQGMIEPGGEIAYTIKYESPDIDHLQQLTLVNRVPDGVMLLPDTIQPAGIVSTDHKSIEWQLTEDLTGSNAVTYRVMRPPIFELKSAGSFVEKDSFVELRLRQIGIETIGYTLHVNATPVPPPEDGVAPYTFKNPGRYAVAVTAAHNNPHLDELCAETFVIVIEARIGIKVNNVVQEPNMIIVGDVVELSTQILPEDLDPSGFTNIWDVDGKMITSSTFIKTHTQIGEQTVGLTITHDELARPIYMTQTVNIMDGSTPDYHFHSAAKPAIIDEITLEDVEPLCGPAPLPLPPGPHIIINEGVSTWWQFGNRTLETSSNFSLNGFVNYLPHIAK